MFANLLHVCNLLSINPEIYFPYTSHKSVIHKNETIFEDRILILNQVSWYICMKWKKRTSVKVVELENF